jgi:hypothetical protein
MLSRRHQAAVLTTPLRLSVRSRSTLRRCCRACPLRPPWIAGNGAGAQTDSTAVAYACPADKRDYDLAWCLGVDNETGAELG